MPNEIAPPDDPRPGRPPKGTPASPGVVVVSLVCVFLGGSFVPGLGLVMALVMWFTSLRHNGIVRVYAVLVGLLPILSFVGLYFFMQT